MDHPQRSNPEKPQAEETAGTAPLALSRRYQSEQKWAEARTVLETALVEHPRDPDLLAELAYLLCYEGKEDQAYSLCSEALEGERGAETLKILAHYYHCRKKLAKSFRKEDKEASSRLRELKKWAKEKGIRLAPFPDIRVSACLIVKDEEENLPSCLQSLKGAVDEVIVVDTGSTDRTPSLAQACGAKVAYFEWCDDFSSARNFALSLTDADWVLWIDADERLDPSSIGAIKSAIIRPHFGGYTIPVVNYLSPEGELDQLVHYPIRLFRNVPGIRFEGRVHEQIGESIHRAGLPIARLEKALIHHFGYRPEAMTAKDKHQRNIDLLKKTLSENPEDGFQWFNLANSYYNAGEWEPVIECCQKAEPSLKPGLPHAQLGFQIWAFALYHLGHYDEGLKVCQKAEKAGIQGPLIEYAKACLLHALKRFPEALSCAQKAGQLPLKGDEAGDITISTYKALYLQAEILAEMGKKDEAVKILKEVKKRAERFWPARLRLIQELRLIGDRPSALREAKEVIRHFQDEPTLSTIRDKGSLPHDHPARVACELAILCAKEEGLRPERLEFLEQAFRFAPREKHLWARWVGYAEQIEDWGNALKAYLEGLERFSLEAGHWVNLSRVLRHFRRYPEALHCLENAATLKPDDPNIYLNTGDLLYEAGEYQQAVEAYRAGVALNPHNAEAWFTLGNALYRMGAPEAAIIAFQQTLRLNPEHPKASHNLNVVREEILERAS